MRVFTVIYSLIDVLYRFETFFIFDFVKNAYYIFDSNVLNNDG